MAAARSSWGFVVVAPALLLACGGSDSGGNSQSGGGTAGFSPDAAVGGAPGTGGATSGNGGSSGGGGGSGGAAVSGGASGLGGSVSGGAPGTGSATSTGGRPNNNCLMAGSYCTWSTASDCCSGRCDGDSCCGFLGDACQNGFGCCEGDCVNGYCQCPTGTLDCGNGCVGILWNDNACGGCNTPCGVNELCEDGRCICDMNLFDPQFLIQCPGGCFYRTHDEQHCGDCTTVCTGGTECSGGRCQCPFGTQDCGSGCVDVTANPLHCGSCPNACDAATEDCVSYQCVCKPGLYACTPGVCVNRLTDSSNCGTCNNVCLGNKTCQNGVCAN